MTILTNREALVMVGPQSVPSLKGLSDRMIVAAKNLKDSKGRLVNWVDTPATELEAEVILCSFQVNQRDDQSSFFDVEAPGPREEVATSALKFENFKKSKPGRRVHFSPSGYYQDQLQLQVRVIPYSLIEDQQKLLAWKEVKRKVPGNYAAWDREKAEAVKAEAVQNMDKGEQQKWSKRLI